MSCGRRTHTRDLRDGCSVRWFAIAIVFAVGACGPDARISGTASLAPPLTLDMLTMTVRDGARTWVFHGSDFQLRSGNGTPTTPTVSTRTRGQIQISYELQASGQRLSQGVVVLPLREDWEWGVNIQVATADPTSLCLGCAGSRAFTLAPAFRPPGRDSIWMVWGGNSISHPVIY